MEEEKEKEEEDPRKKKKEKRKEEGPGENKMSLTIFLFLFITAIIKDAIEIVLGLIPGINLFVWIISIPFTLFIFTITLISGTGATWLFIGQILDLLPFASILPIATSTVILCYIFQKLPAPLKKTVEKTSKFTFLKSKLTFLKSLEATI